MKVPNTDHKLEWSGERFIPGIKGAIALEHIHRYIMARELAASKVVLDIACGEGYGSAILGQVAKHVMGIDVSPDAVAHAIQRYGRDNIEFREGSCAEIPLDNNCVDLVVSFETIEHLHQHDAMLREIRRVLRQDGILIISSPEKFEYSILPRYCNPYHVKELYRHEFEELIGSNFSHVLVFGQRVVYGSGIFIEKSQGSIVTYEANSAMPIGVSGMRRPMYLIAVASNAELSSTASSFFEQPVSENEIVGNLSTALAERDGQVTNLIKTVESLIVDRDAQKRGAEQLQNSIQDLICERDERVSQLTTTLAQRDALVTSFG